MPNDYPNKNFIVGRRSHPAQHHHDDVRPGHGQALDTTLGGGGHFWEQTARLTWQISPKNKIGVYYNNKKRTSMNGVTTTSHEALNRTRTSSRSPTT